MKQAQEPIIQAEDDADTAIIGKAAAVSRQLSETLTASVIPEAGQDTVLGDRAREVSIALQGALLPAVNKPQKLPDPTTEPEEIEGVHVTFFHDPEAEVLYLTMKDIERRGSISVPVAHSDLPLNERREELSSFLKDLEIGGLFGAPQRESQYSLVQTDSKAWKEIMNLSKGKVRELIGVSFDRANLIGVDMTGAFIDTVAITRSDLTYVKLNGACARNLILKRCEHANYLQAEEFEAEQSLIQDIKAMYSRWDRARLHDSTFCILALYSSFEDISGEHLEIRKRVEGNPLCYFQAHSFEEICDVLTQTLQGLPIPPEQKSWNHLCQAEFLFERKASGLDASELLLVGVPESPVQNMRIISLTPRGDGVVVERGQHELLPQCILDKMAETGGSLRYSDLVGFIAQWLDEERRES